MKPLTESAIMMWREECAGSPRLRTMIFADEWQQLCDLALRGLESTQPEAASTEDAEREWLEDELVECMRIVSPGMAEPKPDEITYAIMVTGIRRMVEANTDRYEALLDRWQKRHGPQKDDPK